MDKTDQRETHDFMNVESFSQLPFIRPAPKEKAIRLFGIEFGDAATATTTIESETTNNTFELDSNNCKDNNNNSNSEVNGDSSRRFECHYCCRNFPTSQALGGHQNAHKRERQHAKRAHLQSATMVSDHHAAHVYGLMNYRFGSSVPTTTTTPMPYPTWNSHTSSGSGRFYGISHGHGHGHGHGSSYSHLQQPINGSPLALWRLPATGSPVQGSNNHISFNRERSSLHPLPLPAGEEMNMMNTRASLQVGPSGSQNRYVYDSKPGVNDHVSLDLHL